MHITPNNIFTKVVPFMR